MKYFASEFLSLGGPVIYIIGGLSVLALAIVLERGFFFFKSWENPKAFEKVLGRFLEEGDLEAARAFCLKKDTSIRRLFLLGLGYCHGPRDFLTDALEGQIRKEVYLWSEGLAVLAAVAKTAPLLGLLGTVLGMVEIFKALPETTQSPMVALSGGIWKALLTTVAGLSVAAPGVLCLSLLNAKIDGLEEALYRARDFILKFHAEKGKNI